MKKGLFYTVATIAIVICSMALAYKATGTCYGPILPFDEKIEPKTGILIVGIFLLLEMIKA